MDSYPALPLADLVTGVLGELDRHQYSQSSRDSYRRFYQRLLRWTTAQGLTTWSEAVGQRFLTDVYGVVWAELPVPPPRRYRPLLRFLRCLSTYQRHRTLVRRHHPKPPYTPPPAFAAVWATFRQECVRRGYSPWAARTREARLATFLDYVTAQGVTAADALTAAHLSQYTAALLGYHPKTVASMLTTLRTFLRFLHQAGLHPHDLSGAVPRLRSGHYERLPSVWPADAVPRLLAAVDRGNPTGKRDYAILLLAARLGMRVGDIKALPLAALHWDTQTIAWVQQKTGRVVTAPLLDDVGWALIDYLQHGRPPTTVPEIFVRHHAPFEPFGPHANLHNLVTTYTRRAKIPMPRGSHGLHALRHSLASTLLEAATPLPVIAEILGHVSTHSTQVYLHVDQEALRRCALDPEEVLTVVDD
jgi:integrase/recombinase XerD